MMRVAERAVGRPLLAGDSVLHVRGDSDRPLAFYRGAGTAALPRYAPVRKAVTVVRTSHVLRLGAADRAAGETSAPADITVIDAALIDRVAAATPGRRPGPVRFTGPAPTSPAAAAQWWTARAYVTELVGNPKVAASALVGDSAARLLVAATITAFPNVTPADPEAGDPDVPSFATLHRALAYIDGHARADLGVVDLAAAAHVSVRAIQLAFRRHLDMTPSQYLRRARLARAHDALRSGDPRAVTVTEVAREWGFTHHSRFTALYRRVYGVTPVTTLHG
jgi:AraC-like DNA-binding protein